ncbi:MULTISPECIES: alanine dehydrogenase [unclassified Acinetobacter]|uniref:alanine dehydrogenase n=1 Tax=unclassified Acinetobacter TaxID=196816 RepID=UPI0035BB635E
MKVGIPKEIKNNENRVGLTPSGVHALCSRGHEVLVETGAGLGSHFSDAEYQKAGARMVSASEAWSAEMVIKVKEPQASEYAYFREDLTLFTYLHLAAEPELTEALLKHKVTGIAYETVQLADHSLPLLTPMSEVAGRMSVQIGAQFLQKFYGGKGILLGGVPGVQKGKVTIIGGGIAGTEAAKMAIGLGADVTILDLSPKRLKELSELFGNNVQTLMSTPSNIQESIQNCDLAIGAVLIPGASAPKLVSEQMIESMADGGVVVDIAIDQGGCFATTDRITTHDNPTYVKHGVIHYAVANMPGAVARTSTMALSNATLPYALALADKGYVQACKENLPLQLGLNTLKGHVVYKAVAEAMDLEYTDVQTLLT